MVDNSLKLFAGTACTPEYAYENAIIDIVGSEIKDVSEACSSNDADVVVSDGIAVPGFVDLHTHGYGGHYTTTDDPESFHGLTDAITQHGVTTVYPTTMSASQETLLETAHAFASASESGFDGAKLEGLHLEGPYFPPGDQQGAQDPEVFREPSISELTALKDASGNRISRLTLAPELDGAFPVIDWAREHGIVVSAGHTGGTYDRTVQAFDRGISLVTHLYNGMKQLHHRNPGPLGASLAEPAVGVELIADLRHVHPAAIELAFRAKDEDALVLVTDSIPQTGLPDGEYSLGGKPIVVEDGQSRLKSTNRLAGSTLTMDTAVRNLVDEVGLSFEIAVRAASTNPATQMGLSRRGRLKPGYAADITVLDSEYSPVLTIVDGDVVYRASSRK
ncbi:N-acetylglucosamine-6-phosphate deacetylase [Halorhabdus rudnickae]|uniref:N-acetylglucosamine-6-phosphate deacetylase n=1 Tax=Halorhabdus rudnickae TaxID=1775544 RepID=UPI001082B922|nr:N-acetylglucosamine-6-phosphate deacetylase [Halorhabdus rudnickae]